MCVYETGLLLLFAYIGYRTSAASVELRPRGWRAVAFPCWLHLRDRSGSPWLIVILMEFVVASAACVYETGLLLVCACRTSAASVEPLPRGTRAVAFPLHGFRF